MLFLDTEALYKRTLRPLTYTRTRRENQSRPVTTSTGRREGGTLAWVVQSGPALRTCTPVTFDPLHALNTEASSHSTERDLRNNDTN